MRRHGRLDAGQVVKRLWSRLLRFLGLAKTTRVYYAKRAILMINGVEVGIHGEQQHFEPVVLGRVEVKEKP